MDKIGGNNEKPWLDTTIDPTHTICFHDLNDIYIYIRRFNIQSPFNGEYTLSVTRKTSPATFACIDRMYSRPLSRLSTSREFRILVYRKFSLDFLI